MLQYIRDFTSTWLARVLLVALCIPFVLWGADYYFTDDVNPVIARVDGVELRQNDYRNAVEIQRRDAPATTTEQELRRHVLDRLIESSLVLQLADRNRMRVSSAEVVKAIQGMQDFHDGGLFSRDRYDFLFRAQGRLTATDFEEQIRREMTAAQVQKAVLDSGFVLDDELRRVARLQKQLRDLAYVLFSASELQQQIDPAPDEIDQHYQDHPARYQSSEQVRIAYLELRQADLIERVEVDEEELRSFYQGRAREYDRPELRGVTQLSLNLPADANEADRAHASARAQAILKQGRAGKSLEELIEQEPEVVPAEAEAGASAAESESETEADASVAESESETEADASVAESESETEADASVAESESETEADASVAESESETEADASVAESESETEADASVAESESETEADASVAESESETEADASVAESESETEADASVAESESETEADASVAESESETEADASVAESESETEADASVAESESETEAGASVAETESETEAGASVAESESETEAGASAAESESETEAGASVAESESEAEAGAPAAESESESEAGASVAESESESEAGMPEDAGKSASDPEWELLSQESLLQGVLPNALDVVLFSMQEEGDLSSVIELGQSLHILRLDQIDPEQPSTFENSRTGAERDYRAAEAERWFLELSETLATLSYEHPQDLQVAAEALDQKILYSEHFSRDQGEAIGADPEVRAAAFLEEVLLGGNNSDLIELEQNQVIVLRVDEHRLAERQSLSEVQEQIREELQELRAVEQAQERGQQVLAQLQQGAALEDIAVQEGIEWQRQEAVARDDAELNRALLRRAFRMSRPADSQRNFTGESLGNGDYAVLVLLAVHDLADDSVMSEEDLDALWSEMAPASYLGDWRGIVHYMRNQAKVRILPSDIQEI